MINYLSNPEFTELVLSSLKDSVLIIEDAEKALMKRETEDGFYNSELVSTLLNLTDGLYADLARTSIIATYNCDRNLIDPALLRKGRLRSEYKFTRLNVEKSQILMDKLGNAVKVDAPMTLADIFNYEKQYTNEERKKSKRVVGFGG
jgi:SpoVK/Ycf46/Vps4 family AAA+-type ATPase